LSQVLAASDSGGVDEAPDFSGNLDLLINWVTSGTGKFVDDCALTANGLVK
jgi:hypothetical protein